MPAGERARAIAMVVGAGWCVLALLRPRRGVADVAVAGALGVFAAWWLLDSPVYEGPSILGLTSTAGLAAADLGVPPSLFLSAAVLYAAWRDRRGRSEPEDVVPR